MTPTKRVYLFLIIGLVAASQSGNIIRIGDAHPAAIAAWRLLIAALFLAPFAGRRLKTLRHLSRREIQLLFLASVALSLHFFAWIAAVQMTTVANAAIFFSINPVITATAGHFLFGERVSKKLVWSIVLGFAGIATISWNDLSFQPEHIKGDVTAVICSILFSVYFLLGKTLRKRLDTGVYVTSAYALASVWGFGAMLVLDLPFVDYSGQTWLCFFLMALVPTVLGHTSFNNALRYIAAGRISAWTLSEPLLAGVVAHFAWNESISTGAIFGYALICNSVLLLVFDRGKQVQ
ncbi:MAG: DMT family transporter [Myxococcota bacterium]|nr:DMT family transporter [Myxococcota bacterium]